MQNRVVLKDGTTINDGLVSKSSNNRLLVRLPGNQLVERTILFSDPNKTETIVCYSGAYKYTYTGYTVLYTIHYLEDTDCIELWLKLPEGVVPTFDKELIVPKEYMPY